MVTEAGAHGMVIVVDDGSQDATAELARRRGAVVVTHAESRGYDRALNSGFVPERTGRSLRCHDRCGWSAARRAGRSSCASWRQGPTLWSEFVIPFHASWSKPFDG